MTISANFPSIAPSLQLNFAQTEALDPRITFSRPTTATYYDAKTSAVAEQNLLLYSQTFTNAAWNNYSCTVTGNSIVAPDGTTTGSTLTTTSAGVGSYITEPTGPCNFGLPWTVSIYLQAGTLSSVVIGMSNYSTGGSQSATFNLSAVTATPSNVGYTNPTATITQVGSTAWYRCTITGGAGTSGQLGVVSINVGNGNFYLWGAQVEQRSSATAYTATTTAAITNYIPVLQTASTDTARFDHNPTTRESLGLLIEEQRTNLLTYSSDYTNAIWTKARATIMSAATVAPDGTQTAQQLVEDTTAANSHLMYEAYTITAGSPYVFSMYAKANTRSQISITFDGVVFIFDLSSGTQISGANGTITSVGNGWYRITCYRASITTASSFVFIGLATGGTATYSGNGYSGLFVWGAQLEAGAFATSYIPTVASQVTRSADSASMTGTNFSSWFQSGSGTLYTEFLIGQTTTVYPALPVLYNTSNPNTDVCGIYSSSTTSVGTAIRVSGTVATVQTATISYSSSAKASMSFSPTSVSISANGGAVATGSLANGVSSNLNALSIGGVVSGYFQTISYVRIKKLAYYPIAVTSTNLQALTG